jgi:hypothetical protein
VKLSGALQARRHFRAAVCRYSFEELARCLTVLGSCVVETISKDLRDY